MEDIQEGVSKRKRTSAVWNHFKLKKSWREDEGSSPMPEDATIQNILEDYDDHEEEESGAMEFAD